MLRSFLSKFNSFLRKTRTTHHYSMDNIKDFLRKNYDFLEEFVMNEVDIEVLEKWLIRKTQRLKRIGDKSQANTSKNPRKTSLSRWKFCVHADKRKMLQEMTQSLQVKPVKDHVLWELGNCISSAINADGFHLYIVDEYSKSLICLRIYDDDENSDKSLHGKKIKLKRPSSGFLKITLAENVAEKRESVRLTKIDLEKSFDTSHYDHFEQMSHILCQPIVQPDNQLTAVLEMWRNDVNQPFYEEDDEIVCSYLVWGGIALHYAHLFLHLNKQKKLNDFLLVVVKSIFHDMISIDSLVIKIMNFAQKLVDADRASLFLLDAKARELYATIFDIGNSNHNNKEINNGEPEEEKMFKSDNREIRFPIGTGVAGKVAMTGEILNITDAYSDSRFNPLIDQITGYKTETILCMPIYTRNTIIGVVQMINKRLGSFTKEDEAAFEMFAVYCGLALHHAKLYDKIRRSEQKYKVALEVLAYHNTCTNTEYEQTLTSSNPFSVTLNCDDYLLNPFEIEDNEKVNYALYMFFDLFGLSKFEEQTLIRFVLTVKKNYRRVPYHNWTHGFSVAHCMYTILKRASRYFKPSECIALFIAALCHDLDHRGKNNKFMLDTDSPLASVYSTSTMEHHHFNQTVIILQQENHNIFSKFTNNEYKHVLSLLKHCILATDLAVFFQNKSRLGDIVNSNSFDWSVKDHRLLILAVSMTACDLCASAKSWNVQEETVKLIFEEFYQQGDEERTFGLEPIPMMDRTKIDYQPTSQVGFLNGICIPCYSLLSTLIPETMPLLDECKKNLTNWQEIDHRTHR